MTAFAPIKAPYVVGPYGDPLSLEDLPKSKFERWTASRKASVAIAVANGLITVNEVCERYDLTADELALWQRAFYRSGLKALELRRLVGDHRAAQARPDGR